MVLKRSVLFFFYITISLIIRAEQNSDLDRQIQTNTKKAEAFLAEGKQNAAAQLYNQSAYLLRSANRYEEAANYYQKVLEINIDLGNRHGQMISHNSLAMVYLEAENYQKAVYHLEKELEFRKQINNKAEIINVLTNIAMAENELSSFDSAIDHIEKAIGLAKELNDFTLLKRSYGVAYDIYEKKGNAEKSRAYFELYSAIDKKLKQMKMDEITTEADRKVTQAVTEKQQTEQQLSQTHDELEKTVNTLQKVEKLTREQQMEIELKEAKINEQNALLEAERLRRRFWIIGFSISLFFVVVLTFMIIQIFKANRKINAQRLKLEKQNKEIRSSIRYAQTIQEAMLPATSQIEKYFEPFILYMPKDIVSGDFYWILEQKKEKKTTVYLAVVDCTGHGVPGAFMSMIGNRLLNEIVTERKIESPSEILLMLNTMVREALRQEETDNNDGMDLAFCKFEFEKGKKTNLTFSGAKRPIYIIKNNTNKLINYPGDRKSIGGYSLARKEVKFTNHKDELSKGDMVYMFSDGIVDQNGPERKKFGRLRLEEAIIDCAKLKPSEQKDIFEQRLHEYMDGEEQRDDISMLGLKVI
jgi:serine phosphatase RsbU (regulator of sigma subunit)/tetratricopeptide (TPR) repeat protein